MFFASRPASRRRTVRFTPRPDGLEDRALLNVSGLHSASVVVALDSSNGNGNGNHSGNEIVIVVIGSDDTVVIGSNAGNSALSPAEVITSAA